MIQLIAQLYRQIEFVKAFWDLHEDISKFKVFDQLEPRASYLYQLGCDAMQLPQMSADELWHELMSNDESGIVKEMQTLRKNCKTIVKQDEIKAFYEKRDVGTDCIQAIAALYVFNDAYYFDKLQDGTFHVCIQQGSTEYNTFEEALAELASFTITAG